MSVCSPRPEADARLFRPPDAIDVARFWGDYLDTFFLWPLNAWFAYCFAVRDPAHTET